MDTLNFLQWLVCEMRNEESLKSCLKEGSEEERSCRGYLAALNKVLKTYTECMSEEELLRTTKTRRSFKTDGGGIAVGLHDCKIGGLSWNTRLSQIGRSPEKKIFIATYSLPNIEYVCQIIGKRENGKNITILAHEKFRERAIEIKRRFPEVEIYLSDCTHAKLALVEPHTVWMGSGNFGKSGWFETGIGIHSVQAYEEYLRQLMEHIQKHSERLE